jgi:hypothetical protein
MDLASWLVAEHDDSMFRLTTQLLEVVPHEHRRRRIAGSNSIDWTLYHIARHATLGLRVAGHDPAMSDSLLAGVAAELTAPDAGLQEPEQPWLELIDSELIETYLLSVLDEVRAFLARTSEFESEAVSAVSAGLRAAGIDEEQYGWLYRQWSAPHLLRRWVLVGHVTFHVGEASGVRNQLGFSPFR